MWRTSALSAPQPYCNSAMVWVHPSGDIVVALTDDDRVDLFSTRGERLPASIARYAEGKKQRWRKAGADDGACMGPHIYKRTVRFELAHRQRACDPEFSTFWSPATKDRALVNVGWEKEGDANWICTEQRSLRGERNVGWRHIDELRVLPDLVGPPTRAQTERFVSGDTPPWLAPGAPPRRFGDLQITRGAGDRVHIKLARVMAGHLCGMEGEMELMSARVLEDVSVGCGARGALFDNGVYLWEDGSCSGARATCTGGYFP